MAEQFGLKRHDTFDRQFWRLIHLFIIGILLISFMPYCLTREGHVDFSDTGQIGDTIGGIMSPLIAVLAAFLTFIAFWVQYKANIRQRADIALERFERNLYEMLRTQQEITNALIIEEKGNDVNISHRGRDVFQFVYETGNFQIMNAEGSSITTIKEAINIDKIVRNSISNIKEIWFLDHYFRYLYRIFKYIHDYDNQDVEIRKYEYAAIVRATLSQYELVMLYYNGLSYPKLKTLIEEFTILKNLRIELLANKEEKDYHKNISIYQSEDSSLYTKKAFYA